MEEFQHAYYMYINTPRLKKANIYEGYLFAIFFIPTENII